MQELDLTKGLQAPWPPGFFFRLFQPSSLLAMHCTFYGPKVLKIRPAVNHLSVNDPCHYQLMSSVVYYSL